MKSPSSWCLGLGMLGLGLGLGLSIGRLAAPLAAQTQGPPRPGATGPAHAPTGDQAKDPEEATYRDLGRQYEAFRPVNQTFERVARAIAPSVVHIVARKSAPRDDGQVERFEETGSGVVVRGLAPAEAARNPATERFVLTNNHVVEGAAPGDVSIYLHDGRVLRPRRVWADPKADVAVLQLGASDVPAARLGNSDEVAVGTWVLALGSPFGLTHSVSQGIISARGRYEAELEDDGVENQDFLQTDAAINPGNSGGPLVNLKGEVVGLNTAIASNGGGSQGVGFSIPINLARWVMAQLVATGKVSRGALGVRLEALSPAQAQALGLPRPRGARITRVQDDSPAARSGLAVGDVILVYNGVEVLDFNHLINLVSMTPVGRSAEVVFWRRKERRTAEVKVADRDAMLAADPPATARSGAVGPGLLRRPPRPSPAAPSAGSTSGLGLELAPLDGPAAARRFGLPETARGVLITRLDASSPLASRVQPLDVLTSIDGRPVRDPREALDLLLRRADAPLSLTLLRPTGGSLQPRTVRVP